MSSNNGLKIQTFMDGEVVEDVVLIKNELERAKEALALLKDRLGNARIDDLLKEDIKENIDHYMSLKNNSVEGKFKGTTTELDVKGISMNEFFEYFHKIFVEQNEKALRVAHPEHYGHIQRRPS